MSPDDIVATTVPGLELHRRGNTWSVTHAGSGRYVLRGEEVNARVPYKFPLDPHRDRYAVIDLPLDLTTHEARRLARFVLAVAGLDANGEPVR